VLTDRQTDERTKTQTKTTENNNPRCAARVVIISSELCRNTRSAHRKFVTPLASTRHECSTATFTFVTAFYPSAPGASTGIPGDAKYVTEILRGNTYRSWGTKFNFGQLIVTKIITIVATRCHILRLTCT